jgi:glyoxylase-like metal-dependent hydrolase (beta-lactamase superfamily II)
MRPRVTTFFHEPTFTACHVVCEPNGDRCAVVDTVLDFDPKSGRTSTEHADRVVDFVTSHGLTVEWLLETHAHADHLTASPYLKEKLGGRVAIGEHIRTVQDTFGKLFNAEPGFRRDGSQFDHVFRDGERFAFGAMQARVMHTPGHTPACVTYAIGDAAFVGDTMFMPDYGTARADFPGGDAATLYRSIRKTLALPPETRIFLRHDYKAEGRDEFVWQTTVADERAHNKHVHDGVDEAAFVEMRTARDATLEMPVLLLPSVQVNMRAGRFPPPEDNGISYLKLPLNAV